MVAMQAEAGSSKSTKSKAVSRTGQSLIVRFKKQVLIANDSFYVDQKNQRHTYQFSKRLKYIYFAGPRGQEFILESNGGTDMGFYSLFVRRNGQRILVINDFISYGKKSGFENRKAAWILDLNKDGIFDLIQRDKMQIKGNAKNNAARPASRGRSPASVSRPSHQYKADLFNIRVWDKESQSFIEKPFRTVREKNHFYKKYDFKFKWWAQPSRKRAKGFSRVTRDEATAEISALNDVMNKILKLKEPHAI